MSSSARRMRVITELVAAGEAIGTSRVRRWEILRTFLAKESRRGGQQGLQHPSNGLDTMTNK